MALTAVDVFALGARHRPQWRFGIADPIDPDPGRGAAVAGRLGTYNFRSFRRQTAAETDRDAREQAQRESITRFTSRDFLWQARQR